METPSKNKRNLYAFSLASFLNDLGSNMIYPIWPLFVTIFFGADVIVLGIIDGIGDAIVSISSAFSGYLSDKFRRRKIFISTGYLSAVISRCGYAISPTWIFLIPFKAIDRAGKIRSAPRDAMVAELSTKENRGADFGFLRAMDNFGAILGIVLSIILLKYFGFRSLILLASIPSFFSVIIIHYFIREKEFKAQNRNFSFKLFDNNFKLFIFVNGLFALGSFSYSFFLLYAKNIGFSIFNVSIFYLFFTLSSTIFSYPLGRLTDLIGRKKVLMISFLSHAVVCICLIFARNLIEIILVFCILGFYKTSIDISQKTMASEICPFDFKATFMGSYQLIIGLMAFPASFTAGLLWKIFGMNCPLYFSILLSLTSFLLINLVKEQNMCQSDNFINRI
ncbi:MAG: drug efflux system protein MdtG [Candidatus Methanofastidiosum methylothiophilum]|jgi:MFS family permease|uniref:Drug efflux system protein MdtG n=1 Tax=Candidatus Methanofastidiosum methylothiophilum TaxID=1705564 RepID=A0A150JDI5_9EURY|nr:MAG: drug efflux system protein MdtG [Candidatus Methanofastidiosum methylthiophilus]MBP6931947.1 MFS transporter [Methanofastidiosum sp.]OQC52547.1 MAG: drug efflux system protein MdtG [Euryarchaeota archaeon ADurb.Bin023]KYC57130.1 MAG: drug efflux system protein MdtG [Candidatus Methanofastidiosum methylthiophilus]KYC57886.1 MAG: drug efflux system protein MdtG [Candidatus Methanofastidiosum methylthiophilus]